MAGLLVLWLISDPAILFFMAKEFAEAFYKSDKWQRCRAAFIAERFAIDNGLCEMCHEKPGYIVHHIVELTPQNINNPDITLSWDNLQYVCKKCHDKHHDVFCEHSKRYFFDDNGMIQPIPP